LTRQPAGKPKDKRKGRRRPVVPHPIAMRARVAPIGGGAKADSSSAATPAPAKRIPGLMDFSYVGPELRRIAVFIIGMVGLLIVLSFVLH